MTSAISVRDVIARLARDAHALVSASATGRFMSDAKGAGPRTQKQGPLRIVTTRLARSVIDRRRRDNIFNMQVVGDTLIVNLGTRVEYAAVHEYGFDGTVNVPAHTRKGGISVRAHTRAMHMPARPYLRPAYEDQKAELKKRLIKHVKTEIVNGWRL